MTRVTGALVSGVQSAFAANWVYCCGEVIAGPRFYPVGEDGGPACGLSVVSSPSDAQQPIRLLCWLSFINARRRLWIASSYFIPDQHLRKAVQARGPRRRGRAHPGAGQPHRRDPGAVRRPRVTTRSCCEAGVRIFEYQPSMMHAKTVVVDDALDPGRLGQHGRAQHGDQRGEPARRSAEPGFARGGRRRDRARPRPRRRRSTSRQWRRRAALAARCASKKAAKILIEQY